jgi:hypothetical protein
MRAAKETGSLMPPKHILNAPTKLMKELGYGAGYEYDHDAEEGFSGADYFPEGMRRRFYRPTDRGAEAAIAERMARWDALRGGSAAVSGALIPVAAAGRARRRGSGRSRATWSRSRRSRCSARGFPGGRSR